MLGKPKYKYGDRVRFSSQQEAKVGIVAIVDAYGSWTVPEEPSYDIMATNDSGGCCLYKHIAEQYIVALDDVKGVEEELLSIEAEVWRYKPKGGE